MIHILRFRVLFGFALLLAGCAQQEFLPAGTANGAWTPVMRESDAGTFVQVPAGCFVMGSMAGERDESPLHRVCVRAFWIGQTEVTNTQYAECVAAQECTPPQDRVAFDDPAKADHPVVSITWEQADIYARWRGGRLPTEAEWEYAARGTEGWPYPWGTDAADCDRANIQGCVGDTRPVGLIGELRSASWVGALDMAGNVWEWVADWYNAGAYVSLADGVINPTGPGEGTLRVQRGGSWQADATRARATFRNRHAPNYYGNDQGFRIVMQF